MNRALILVLPGAERPPHIRQRASQQAVRGIDVSFPRVCHPRARQRKKQPAEGPAKQPARETTKWTTLRWINYHRLPQCSLKKKKINLYSWKMTAAYLIYDKSKDKRIALKITLAKRDARL